MAHGQLVPLIKTIHAETLIELLKHFEADIYPLLAAAGLPEDVLNTGHEYVPEGPVRNLLAMIAERAEPEYYGDLLRTAIREYFIPRMLKYLRAPATVGDALRQMETAVLHDSSAAKVSIGDFNGTPWCCRYKAGEFTSSFLWAEIFAILFIIEFVRFISNSRWHPNCVTVQSPDADNLVALLEDPTVVLYTSRKQAGVELSNEVMALPVCLPSRYTAPEHTASEPSPRSYVETLYLALAPYLSRQNLPIEQAAALLETSPRTLQRRLAAEGTSFRSVRENIMLATACQLMESKSYSLTDIASELGYSDIAHFSRAFKKLTGFPPKEYRRRFLRPSPG
ncbi:AraC-type DNA-binding protein [Ferrimonas sediminum]|uniref:AraC-type DNA-binding protein n=1 Tax=Ferrimonas sediminum TaxID=718193 RepID=A0A1G8SH00_9GAMM|nr:helix-turn-helix transcriptional regulator [Ferrimonas sediminum]SDJ28498.1 AraC-type DNA-binding protein [Ferrimonas sediminum]